MSLQHLVEYPLRVLPIQQIAATRTYQLLDAYHLKIRVHHLHLWSKELEHDNHHVHDLYVQTSSKLDLLNDSLEYRELRINLTLPLDKYRHRRVALIQEVWLLAPVLGHVPYLIS